MWFSYRYVLMYWWRVYVQICYDTQKKRFCGLGTDLFWCADKVHMWFWLRFCMLNWMMSVSGRICVVLAMNVCGLGAYWLCAGNECMMFKYKFIMMCWLWVLCGLGPDLLWCVDYECAWFMYRCFMLLMMSICGLGAGLLWCFNCLQCGTNVSCCAVD